MPATWRDSKLSAFTGTQPLASVTPARSAMKPAFCGGITLSTSAWWRVPKAVSTSSFSASTRITCPSSDCLTHSIMSPYSAFQPCWNSACLEKLSLASSSSTLLRGLCCCR